MFFKTEVNNSLAFYIVYFLILVLFSLTFLNFILYSFTFILNFSFMWFAQNCTHWLSLWLYKSIIILITCCRSIKSNLIFIVKYLPTSVSTIVLAVYSYNKNAIVKWLTKLSKISLIKKMKWEKIVFIPHTCLALYKQKV